MATSVSGIGSVSQDQFLQLLIAQLQNQDPLNPVSNDQFIQQVTSLNTLSGIQSLNANFSEMLKLQQITQGADLIGKKVTYLQAGSATPQTGTVSSLKVNDGKVNLLIGTTSITLDQITGFNG